MFPEQKKIKIKWYVSLSVVFLGLFILAVSVMQASWENLTDDKNYDRFRIHPVEFEIEGEDGQKENVRYNLPQINQVPGEFFYPLKRARDGLWLELSKKSNQVEEGKMYLLLADKKVAELLILSQRKSDLEMMVRCAEESVDYLERVGKLSLEMSNVVEGRKIGEKVKTAKYFYSQVFESTGQVVEQEVVYKEISDRVLKIEERL